MYFAKHETFHIRDGWLYKGLKAVQSEPGIFLEDNAPERLGLGKNMVRALRFWMQATGLTQEQFQDRRRVQTLTEFGKYVLQYDPYQELDGTLWLIHYQLVSSKGLATTWYWFFNHYSPITFSYVDFIERLKQWINTQREDGKEVAESSLRKDFDCLVRTYLSSERNKSPEDLMESPLSTLGLLSTFTEHDEHEGRIRRYRLESGAVSSIPPLAFLYVLLDQQEKNRPTSSQVTLQEVLREPMNVGNTFGITILTLEDLLMRLEEEGKEFRVRLTRTGQLDNLTLPDIPANDILRAFYEKQKVEEGARVWLPPALR